MCGLNGIFAYHSAASAPDARELIATRDAMAARGPDGFGSWWSEDRRCGLGHRRLSILDLSERGAQPMPSHDGRTVVVFNGEIYNYPALRTELEQGGVRFQTGADTEVLLHLYAKHGAGMVDHLRGMFAFAIWDGTRGALFLARDPYGIKPLYTANDGWTFRFASQVKALLAGGHVSRDPEPAGVVGFHLFGSVPEPFTLHREIRALPAGHTQWIDAAGARLPRPFANLASVIAEGAETIPPSGALAETVRDGALDSVRAHLLADVDVGVFLSAGIDSGALLGLMRDAGQANTHAITLEFDRFRGTDEDEAPLAARVAKTYGANHIVRTVDEREFASDLPLVLAAMDQPSIDGLNTWFVAKAAREAGLKVAISGLGGDELLAGYPSFADIPRWHRRFGALATIPGLGWMARTALGVLSPGLAKSKPKALGLLDYADSWAGAYLLRRGLFLPHELAGIMDSDVAREGLRRLKPLHRLENSMKPDPGSDTGRVCALESANYLRNQLLRDADWAGMAHGIEVRVPLVDVHLLRKLAPELRHLKTGDGKAALAAAPRLPLPEEVVRRAKTGFAVPTGDWIEAATQPATIPGETASARSKGLDSRKWSRVVFTRSDERRARAA